jgi:uncharacterized protein (TIGR03067 family)
MALLGGPLLAGALLAADAPKAGTAEEEMKKLQGSWKVVSLEVEGKAIPEEEFKDVRVIFKGDKMFSTKGGKEGGKPNRYKLDPSKTPKHIDIFHPATVRAAGKKKEEVVELTSPEIYSLEGNKLKICGPRELSGPQGKAMPKRPTEFRATPKSKQALMILERE